MNLHVPNMGDADEWRKHWTQLTYGAIVELIGEKQLHPEGGPAAGYVRRGSQSNWALFRIEYFDWDALTVDHGTATIWYLARLPLTEKKCWVVQGRPDCVPHNWAQTIIKQVEQSAAPG